LCHAQLKENFVPNAFPGFPSEMVQFFRGLKRNNRREWFQPRKHLYEQHVKEPMLELVAAINHELMKFAPDFVTDPKKAVFRIYRDTRFSADKTPYKTQIAASFFRRGADHTGTGGFYLGVSLDQIEIAGGIYRPSPETTFLVRTHIAKTYPELRRILANRKARKLLGELQGDELTRAPKGFDALHPALDLIKKKDWIYDATLDPALATNQRLFGEIVQRFRAMLPLIEYLNRPLIGRKPPREPLERLF
jgi:uncharacterized protein (TIGR02453 family)